MPPDTALSQNPEFELFDIQNDISEKHNLADSQPERVKTLAKVLGNHLRATDAQMPTIKITGKQVPYPDEVVE